jgi:hypothetical protein
LTALAKRLPVRNLQREKRSRLEFIDRAPQAVGGKSRKANDPKAYYPGPVPLRVQVTGDRRSGRLLGGQILGNRRAEISKRIDIFATALFQDASVEYLNDLDLSYPPWPLTPLIGSTQYQSFDQTRRTGRPNSIR